MISIRQWRRKLREATADAVTTGYPQPAPAPENQPEDENAPEFKFYHQAVKGPLGTILGRLTTAEANKAGLGASAKEKIAGNMIQQVILALQIPENRIFSMLYKIKQSIAHQNDQPTATQPTQPTQPAPATTAQPAPATTAQPGYQQAPAFGP